MKHHYKYTFILFFSLFINITFAEVTNMKDLKELQELKLKIVQVGDPVLRTTAKTITQKEIQEPAIQQLIDLMKNTMRDAPGVGLAAPQIGIPLQIAVIEDREEYIKLLKPEELKEKDPGADVSKV